VHAPERRLVSTAPLSDPHSGEVMIGAHSRHSERQRPAQLLERVGWWQHITAVSVQGFMVRVKGTRPEHAACDEPCPAEEEQHGADNIAEYHETEARLWPTEVDGRERINLGEIRQNGNGELFVNGIRYVRRVKLGSPGARTPA